MVTHFNSIDWTGGPICFSSSLAQAENTCPLLTANTLSYKCLSRCCRVSGESWAFTAFTIYRTGSGSLDISHLLSSDTSHKFLYLCRNTFSNLLASKSLQRPDISSYFFLHRYQSASWNMFENKKSKKQKAVQLSSLKIATHWNLLFVFALLSLKEIKACA